MAAQIVVTAQSFMQEQPISPVVSKTFTLRRVKQPKIMVSQNLDDLSTCVVSMSGQSTVVQTSEQPKTFTYDYSYMSFDERDQNYASQDSYEHFFYKQMSQNTLFYKTSIPKYIFQKRNLAFFSLEFTKTAQTFKF